MKKAMILTLSSVLAVTFFFTLVSVTPAEAEKETKTPIWQIFEEGKAKSVKWVDADNPRFAVYDAGTPADESDDVVLDKETKLVWKKIAGTTLRNWYDATYDCIGEDAGGRMGWRLPTVEELLSLAVRSFLGLSLPIGHPFIIIDDPGTQPSYWSSTTDINNPDAAYPVCFAGLPCIYESLKINPYNYVWCVRGGHGYDAY